MKKPHQTATPEGVGYKGRIELDALQVFDAVMAERNMAQAAKRLAITPSAVSHTVARLRQLFNDVLFIRETGGVSPTPRAIELWEQIAEPLERLRYSVGRNTFNPKTDEFSISIAMNDMLSQLVLPSLYEALHRRAPRMVLRVQPRSPLENELAILKGSLDYAIAISTAPVLPQLRTVRLWEDKFLCLCAASHPLNEGRRDFSAFDAWPRVAVSPDGATVGGAELAMRKMGSRKGTAFVVSAFTCVPNLLLGSNNAVALMPAKYAMTIVAKNPALTFLPVDFELPKLTYELVWHERTDRRSSHRWARDLIQKSCQSFAKRQSPV